MATGGGVDIAVSKHFAIRPIQVNYLFTRFPNGTNDHQTSDNFRLTTGLVVRFGDR